MKKALYSVLLLLLVLSLTASAAPAATSAAQTASIPLAIESSAIVRFTDPALEAMVRGAMGKQEGDITASEAEAVT